VLGQPFAARVTARNGAGNTTVNYTNATGYAKAINLSLSSGGSAGTLYVDSTASGTGAVPASKFANASACGSLAAVTTGGIGTACYTDATGKLSYVFSTFPTTSTAIVLHAEDADTGTSTAGTYTDTGINAYAGRLRLLPAYGSVSPVWMSMEAQYWSGQTWVKNTADSCTPTTGATPLVTFPSITDWTLTPNAFASGAMSLGGLKIEKASAGTTTITATVPGWLNPAPSATATIGIYGTKESRKTIHIRELY
jgi:hypothetical protein